MGLARPVNKVKINPIAGNIIGQRNIINTNKSGNEKYSIFDFVALDKILLGNNSNKIFEPSSGGIGIRLKRASKIFTMTMISAIEIKDGAKEPSTPANRIAHPKTNARTKFETIPAPATSIVPHFLFLKFASIYGTGFAHPIINPALNTTRRSGRITEPTISICLSGLSVSRPAYRAVGSPCASATRPWATS